MLFRVAAALFVTALALWTRAGWNAVVFVRGETVPLDGDCQYHLRRALQTLANFPHVPVRDPWLDWPRGAIAPWGPGFDQLLALPAWVVGAAHDPSLAARLIAWVPAVLGVAVALLAMSLARALEPDPARRDTAAIVAGVVTAALPTAVRTSFVGRTDHHVAEALCVALVTLWIATAPLPDAPLRARWRFEALGAALVFGSVHVFTGTVMTLGLATVALAIRLLRAEGPTFAGSGSAAMLGGASLVAVIDNGWIRAQATPFHHLQLSWLHVSLLASAGAVLGVLALAASGQRGVSRRALFSVAVLAPAALLVGVLAPTFRHELSAGLMDWLATRDPWMRTVAESQPLLSVGVRGVFQSFGVLSLVALPLFALALRRARRGTPTAFVALAVMGSGLVALTLLQNRFGRAIVPLFGVWMALGTVEAVARLRRRADLAAVLLAGLWVVADPEPRELLRPARAGWTLGSTEAALYLRRAAPSVSRGVGSGVLAHWTLGHEVLHLGCHPVLVAGFGPYTGVSTWAEVESVWPGDEAHAITVMRAHDAGFLVVPSQALLFAGTPRGLRPVKRSSRGERVLDSAYLRAVPLAAMVLGGGGNAALGVLHLARLRPRFASPDRLPGLAAVQGTWVYERVEGARVEGSAPEGARVALRLPLSVRGVTRTWEAWTVSHAGRWSITVPLSTGWSGDGGVSTGPRYALTINGVPRGTLTVRESEIHSGAVIPAPER